MRYGAAVAAVLGAAIACSGCVSDGLSPRETNSQDYSALVYSGYPTNSAAATGAARTAEGVVHDPISVAIVQAGEVSPPQTMLDELQRHRELFSRVEGLPELTNDYGPAALWRLRMARDGAAADPAEAEVEAAGTAISRMRQAALDVGADYLLFVGGSVDHGTAATPLCVGDLTIVGAFVVPSHVIHAVGKASASLIDARTGRIVLVVSGDAQRNGMSPSMLTDGAEGEVVEETRNDLVRDLTRRLVAQLTENLAGTKG